MRGLVSGRSVVVGFAVLVVAGVVCAAALATFPGSNGRIAFTQGDQNGIAPTSIASANPDGLQQKQLPLPDGIGVEFFSGKREFVPVIESLGGKGALHRSVTAVEDAGDSDFADSLRQERCFAGRGPRCARHDEADSVDDAHRPHAAAGNRRRVVQRVFR